MSKKRNKIAKGKANSAPVVVPSGTYDIAIVGGGASGLACAISCMQHIHIDQRSLERSTRSIPRIVILESGKRIGTSIMRSGNGRCNFSNAAIDTSRYHHAAFVEEAFLAQESASNIPSVLDWFEQLGLVWKEMPGSDGLLYPFSNKANSVLDILRLALVRYDIAIRTSSVVQEIRAVNLPISTLGTENVAVFHNTSSTDSLGLPAQGNDVSNSFDRFVISGETAVAHDEVVSFKIHAHQVVIASGGATSEQFISNFKVPFVDPRPLLGPLKAELCANSKLENSKSNLKDLDGIRMQAAVRVPSHSFEEEGEILFREYGVSGIVIFNASRYVKPGERIILDLVPHCSAEELTSLLEQRIKVLDEKKPENFFTGFILPPLAKVLLQIAGLLGASRITKKDIPLLVKACKEFSLIVQGIADTRVCQVKRGGVLPSAVNAATMQLDCCSGVFVLGEALDVDGPCGGYNLHWAWTTGLLAGQALSHNFLHDSNGER